MAVAGGLLAGAVIVAVLLVSGPTGVFAPSAQATPTGPLGASASPTPRPTAPPASPSRIPLPSSAQLSAPSSSVVWALVGGQALFISTDRGDTWREHPLPAGASYPEMSFISEREGWLMSAELAGPECVEQPVQLWHTADGAATYGSVQPSGLETRTCKGGLSFIDAQRGFISASAPRTSPVIYRTTDGGRTWSPSRPLPDPPGFNAQAPDSMLHPGGVGAFGATLLVAAAGQTTRGGSLYVYRSTDGGQSWSYAATVPLTSSLAFVTASHWIELISAQYSQETTDAGITWHPFSTTYSQAAPVKPSVVFADLGIGYATVRGTIQRTLDGGVHWTALLTPGT